MAGPYIVDIGFGFSTTPAAATMNPASAVPAGTTIIILAFDGGTTPASSTVTDSQGNTYHQIVFQSQNNAPLNGADGIFYAFNVNALSTSDTITFTDSSAAGGNTLFFDAAYIVGLASGDPLDSGMTAVSFGSGASAAITSGAPSSAGRLLVCQAANVTSIGTVTGNSQNWLNPFAIANTAIAQEYYGTAAQSVTQTVTSGVWATFIVGFKLATPDPNLSFFQIMSGLSPVTTALQCAIPAGALILVDGFTGAPTGKTCTITDTQGNLYKYICEAPVGGNSLLNGTEVWFYAYNINGLTTSDTITMTDPFSAPDGLGMAFNYSTTISGSQDPLDHNTIATSYGQGNPYSVSSGVPTQTNELFYVALGGVQVVGAAFTTPPVPAPWTWFWLGPNTAYLINSTLTSQTFSGSFSTSAAWSLATFAFRNSPFSYSRPPGEVARGGAPGINAWPNRRAKDVNRGGKLLRKVLQFGNAASVDIQTPVEGNWWFNPPLTVSAVAKSMAIIGGRFAASMTAKFSGVSRSVSESRNSAAMTAKFTGASRSMVESKSSAALSAKFSAASSALVSARGAASMLAKFSATAKALVVSRGASSALAKFSATAKALVGSSGASSALAKFSASTKALANSRGVLSGSIVFSATGATKALTAARGSASMLASFAGQSSARVKSFGSNSGTVSFVARSASKAMARASNTATATFSATGVSKAVLAARGAPSMLASFAGRSSARVRSLGSNSALASFAARSASMVMSRASNTATAVFSATGVTRALTSSRGSASLLASFAARSASRSAARASNTATATFSATGVTRALTAARAAASMTASFSATARAIATGRGSNSGTAMFSATGATKALVSARAAASLLASFTGRSAAKALSSAGQSLKASASGRSSASTRSRVGQLLTASFSGHSIATAKARSSSPHSTVSMAARSFATFMARGANIAFAQVVATASMSMARLTAFGQATPISSDIPIGRLLGPTVPRARTFGPTAPRVRTLSAPPGA